MGTWTMTLSPVSAASAGVRMTEQRECIVWPVISPGRRPMVVSDWKVALSCGVISSLHIDATASWNAATRMSGAKSLAERENTAMAQGYWWWHPVSSARGAVRPISARPEVIRSSGASP